MLPILGRSLLGVLAGSLLWASCAKPPSGDLQRLAGNGEPGFRDGSPDEARFHAPSGMVLNADGSILYIADSLNHRIRAIALKGDGKIFTAAGSGTPGHQDGSAATASFDHPQALALLPDNRIALFDSGNRRLRAFHPASGTVMPLAGNGAAGLVDGAAELSQMDGIGGMAFHPADRSLYFTQPGQGALRRFRLDLETVETLLKDSVQSARPGALAAMDGQLYVSDRDSGKVFLVDLSNNRANLRQVGQGKKVVALAGAGGNLYALQADEKEPWIRVLPGPAPWWRVPPVDRGFTRDWEDAPPGLLAGPGSVFYLSNPANHSVWVWSDPSAPRKDPGSR